jgi:hypothetical protein
MKLSVDEYFKSTKIEGARSLRATSPFSVIKAFDLGRITSSF